MWRSHSSSNGSLEHSDAQLSLASDWPDWFQRGRRRQLGIAAALALLRPQRDRRRRDRGRRRAARRQRAGLSRPRRRALRRAALARRAAATAAHRSGFATRCRRSATTSRHRTGARRSPRPAGTRASRSRPASRCGFARSTSRLTGEARARPAVHGGARASRSRQRRSAEPRRVRATQTPLVGPRRASAAMRTRSSRPARIDVYPEERAADIALHVRLGRALRVRPHRADTRRADRAASVVVPDFHRGRAVRRSQTRRRLRGLADSGYFRTIDVRPLPADPATRTIPIAVALTSAARTQTSYGVGFSDRHGPALSLRPQQPALQRPRPSIRRQRTALARHLGGPARTTACR